MHTDKSRWTHVKFGDVVRQVKDKVAPWESGLERYIAGEHMDTDDLRIRRWGEINDDYLGPAFHMRFRPGQVLYGSRRTYLRKVAVPDFEGICANTTFVLEPKDRDLLLPELLPFIMQTEAFHEHSIKQSKGSVNPYVNFSDLAWYEFALPPLDEQRKWVETLQAIEEVSETLTNAQLKLRRIRHSVEEQNFLADGNDNEVSFRQLLDRCVLSLQTGPFGTVLKASSYRENGHPVVNPSDMVDGRVVLDNCRYVDDHDWKRLERYQLQVDDMFIGRKGDMNNLVFAGEEYQGYLIGSDCIRFRVVGDLILPKYLFYYLRAETTRQWLQGRAYGTVMPGINEKLLARMIMRLPGRKTQRAVVAELDEIDVSNSRLVERFLRIRHLKSSVLSRLQPEW